MLKLLVIDDDPLVHQRVANCFSVDAAEVGYASSAEDAHRVLRREPAEICLLDLILPGTSGKVLCEEISRDYSAGIIVVSCLDSREEQISLLELGADDYIVKPFDDLELRARVNALSRRMKKQPVDADRGVFSSGVFVFNERRVERSDGTTVTLTSGEASVLAFMLRNSDMILSRDDILAVSRMRQHGGPADRSVDSLIRRLRRKVETDPSSPRHIMTVWGRGYRFVL